MPSCLLLVVLVADAAFIGQEDLNRQRHMWAS
jgi:hypothetical protein